jgi:hypothetical protein
MSKVRSEGRVSFEGLHQAMGRTLHTDVTETTVFGSALSE